MTDVRFWLEADWVAQAELILNSWRTLFGTDLIDRSGVLLSDADAMFHADRVIVSHSTDDDPLLNYGNAAALKLWEMGPELFIGTPSRKTAEPLHREERARLLERTTRDGYVDDYRGVRISSAGQRFRIEQATVWNLTSAGDEYAGQAATFTDWTPLAE